MAPETAREAWLRGHEDALRYISYGDPSSWRAITGSDPTDEGYAERIFDRLARDWKAGWNHGAALIADGSVPCGCEHVSHMEEGTGHLYMGVRAGQQKAQHVGRVCDACAATHMKPYLVKPED
jgi:hypothetical protein